MPLSEFFLHRRAVRARALICAAALACAAPLAAQAEVDADGIWRCLGPDQNPVGFVTIQWRAYDFVATDAAWQVVDNATNGSGSLQLAGNRLTPLDGPLLTQLAVTGTITDGVLSWTGPAGAAMACHR